MKLRTPRLHLQQIVQQIPRWTYLMLSLVLLLSEVNREGLLFDQYKEDEDAMRDFSFYYHRGLTRNQSLLAFRQLSPAFPVEKRRSGCELIPVKDTMRLFPYSTQGLFYSVFPRPGIPSPIGRVYAIHSQLNYLRGRLPRSCSKLFSLRIFFQHLRTYLFDPELYL